MPWTITRGRENAHDRGTGGSGSAAGREPAAVAGIAFSVLASAAFVLLRLSVPAYPGVAGDVADRSWAAAATSRLSAYAPGDDRRHAGHETGLTRDPDRSQGTRRTASGELVAVEFRGLPFPRLASAAQPLAVTGHRRTKGWADGRGADMAPAVTRTASSGPADRLRRSRPLTRSAASRPTPPRPRSERTSARGPRSWCIRSPPPPRRLK